MPTRGPKALAALDAAIRWDSQYQEALMRCAIGARAFSLVLGVAVVLATGCGGRNSAGIPAPFEPTTRPEIDQGHRHGVLVTYKVPTVESGPSGIATGA